MIETKELQRLQKAITPGKWETKKVRDNFYRVFFPDGNVMAEVHSYHGSKEGAEAITLIPDLLADNLRLREALESVRSELSGADLITHHGSRDSAGNTGQSFRSASAIMSDLDAALGGE